MSGKKSLRKGSTEERAVVNLFREHHLCCERTLEKGARSDGTPTWDIDLFYRGREEAPLIGECKNRESLPEYLFEWLGDNDWLSLRKNRKPRLYVMSEETFIRLVKEASCR